MRHPLNYCPNFNVFKLNYYLQTTFLIVPLTLHIIRLLQLQVLFCDDNEKQEVVADFLSSATIIEKAPIPRGSRPCGRGVLQTRPGSSARPCKTRPKVYQFYLYVYGNVQGFIHKHT